jgi:ubiquitin-conjugating enzyme E2 D/E
LPFKSHLGRTPMALARIMKELKDINEDTPDYVNARPYYPDDMFRWQATILGPPGTPYQGGIFLLDINFPADYPIKPAKFKFTTKVFHPNVFPNGNICMEIHGNQRTLTISKLLLSICSLLDDPNTGSPANPEAGHLYRFDRDKYNKIARQWTRKYAM